AKKQLSLAEQPSYKLASFILRRIYSLVEKAREKSELKSNPCCSLCYNGHMKSTVLEYNTIFQKEKEGGYSVWVPSLPGCVSQGETFEEALENIKEAISLYVESAKDDTFEEDNIRSQFLVPVSISATT